MTRDIAIVQLLDRPPPSMLRNQEGATSKSSMLATLIRPHPPPPLHLRLLLVNIIIIIAATTSIIITNINIVLNPNLVVDRATILLPVDPQVGRTAPNVKKSILVKDHCQEEVRVEEVARRRSSIRPVGMIAAREAAGITIILWRRVARLIQATVRPQEGIVFEWTVKMQLILASVHRRASIIIGRTMVRLILAHVRRLAGALKNMMLFLWRTMMCHPKEMKKQIITLPRWFYTIPSPLRRTGMIFHHPPFPQKWCWHWILHRSLPRACISIMVQPNEGTHATTTRNRPQNPRASPPPRKKDLPRQKEDLPTTPIGLSSMIILSKPR